MSVQQLSAVFERSRSRGGARLVLLSIANHDGDGGSWPTISTLARESGLTERSVHEALRTLKSDGELKVHPNAGGTMDWRNDRRPNRYEIVLPHGVEDPATPSTHGVEDPAPRGGSSPRHGVEETATQTVLEPSNNRPTRAAVDRSFNAFWLNYPKKTAKRSALLAYEKAVQRAKKDHLFPTEKINDAAARYATAVKGKDPQYVKNPTTWLNGDCWEDELRSNGHRPLNDFPEEI